jgi:hypothetical protein
MQMKDLRVCTNHGAVLVTSHRPSAGRQGEGSAPHLAWVEVVAVVEKSGASCLLRQCLLEPLLNSGLKAAGAARGQSFT